MKHELGIIDFAVFFAMLGISMFIGIWFKLTGGRQKTTSEFLLADKSMSILPVAFSLMASFMSAITLLGVSAEAYTYGASFVLINISYIIGTPISAFIFLPTFYRLKITSIYEYLEIRYSRSVRIVASSVFMVQMIFYMSIVLYAPALALSAVANISKWTSIMVVGAVCTVYCTIGGMKAVLWTDVFQSVLMFLAMIIIIVKGSIDVGGLGNVFEIASNTSRLDMFNFNPDPRERHTVWSLVVGGTFIYVSIYGVNQTQIQRLMTVKTLKKSQAAIFISWPLTTLLSLLTALTGLVIYANFQHEDPIYCGRIQKPDQLLPFFAVSKLTEYPGLAGIIIAGIFSGSLSTVSSFVNSLSAVTLEDYLKPIFKGNSRFYKNEIAFTKFLAFFYGALCIILTFLVDKMTGLLQASLTVFGLVGGPLLMLFASGVCLPITNTTGVMTGFVASLGFAFWMGFGALFLGKRPVPLPVLTINCSSLATNTTIPWFKPQPREFVPSSFFLYNVSYLWFAAYSWAIGMLVSVLISWLTRSKTRNESRNILPKTQTEIPLMNIHECESQRNN